MSSTLDRLARFANPTVIVAYQVEEEHLAQAPQLSLMRQISRHISHSVTVDCKELYQFSVTNLIGFSKYWSAIEYLIKRRNPHLPLSQQQGPTTVMAPLILAGGAAIWSLIRTEMERMSAKHLSSLVKTIELVRSYPGMIQPYPEDRSYFDGQQEKYINAKPAFSIDEKPPRKDDIQEQFAYLRNFGRAHPSPHIDSILEVLAGKKLTVQKCLIAFSLLYYTDFAFVPEKTRNEMLRFLKLIENHPKEAAALDCPEILGWLKKIIQLKNDFHNPAIKQNEFWTNVRKEPKPLLLPLLNILGPDITVSDLNFVLQLSISPFDMRLLIEMISRRSSDTWSQSLTVNLITRGIFADNLIFQIPRNILAEALGYDAFADFKKPNIASMVPFVQCMVDGLLDLDLISRNRKLCILEGILRHFEVAAIENKENQNAYKELLNNEMMTDIGLALSRLSYSNPYHRCIVDAWIKRMNSVTAGVRGIFLFYSSSLSNNFFSLEEDDVFLAILAMLKDYGNTEEWYLKNRARAIYLLTHPVLIEQFITVPFVFPPFMNCPEGASTMDAAAAIYLKYFKGDEHCDDWFFHFVTGIVRREDSAFLQSSLDALVEEMNRIGWSLLEIKHLAAPSRRFLTLLRAAVSNPDVIRKSSPTDFILCVSAFLKHKTGSVAVWREAHELFQKLENELLPHEQYLPLWELFQSRIADVTKQEESTVKEISLIKTRSIFQFCTHVEIHKAQVTATKEKYELKQQAVREKVSPDIIHDEYSKSKIALLDLMTEALQQECQTIEHYFHERLEVDADSFTAVLEEDDPTLRLESAKRWEKGQKMQTKAFFHDVKLNLTEMQKQFKLDLNDLRQERTLKLKKVEVLATMAVSYSGEPYRHIMDEFLKNCEQMGLESIQRVQKASSVEEIDSISQEHAANVAVQMKLHLLTPIYKASNTLMPSQKIEALESELLSKESEIQRLKKELESLLPTIPSFALDPD